MLAFSGYLTAAATFSAGSFFGASFVFQFQLQTIVNKVPFDQYKLIKGRKYFYFQENKDEQ